MGSLITDELLLGGSKRSYMQTNTERQLRVSLVGGGGGQ